MKKALLFILGVCKALIIIILILKLNVINLNTIMYFLPYYIEFTIFIYMLNKHLYVNLIYLVCIILWCIINILFFYYINFLLIFMSIIFILIIILHIILYKKYQIDINNIHLYNITQWYPVYSYREYNTQYDKNTTQYHYKTYYIDFIITIINNEEYVINSRDTAKFQHIPLLFDKYYMQSIEDYRNIPLNNNMTLKYQQCQYTYNTRNYSNKYNRDTSHTIITDVYEIYIWDKLTNICYYSTIYSRDLFQNLIPNNIWLNNPLMDYN